LIKDSNDTIAVKELELKLQPSEINLDRIKSIEIETI